MVIDNNDLKEQLASLLFEYEELVNHIGPAIEQKYISLFGFLEIDAYELEIELAKLQKKVQIIQSDINQRKPIDLEKINENLKELFEEYDERLEKQKEEFHNNINQDRTYLSKEDAVELKEKYRFIIKSIHPDLNGDLSESEKDLFNQATVAFDSGDLETIKIIYSILENNDNGEEINENYLGERIEKIKEKIRKYKEEYPYNKLEIIENEECIDEYMNFLKDLIKSYKEKIEYYKTRLEEVIFIANSEKHR